MKTTTKTKALSLLVFLGLTATVPAAVYAGNENGEYKNLGTESYQSGESGSNETGELGESGSNETGELGESGSNETGELGERGSNETGELGERGGNETGELGEGV